MGIDEIKTILFNDESNIICSFLTARYILERETRTGLEFSNLQPALKYGDDSVIVWVCFSYHDAG